MKSAKEIALEYFWKEYQDCYAIETDYNKTDPSIIHDFEHELGGDVEEMAEKINKLIKLKCKETAQIKIKDDTHDLLLLKKLLKYSDRYEISIQFWPENTAVYIAKDGVDLQSFGGNYSFAIQKSIDYLKRINSKTKAL